MKKKDKIHFLNILFLLNEKIHITDELLTKIEQNIEDIKDINEKKGIVLDFIESSKNNKSNDELLIKILNLRNIQLDEIIKNINEKIRPERSTLALIDSSHVDLFMFLIKKNILDIEHSKEYIEKFLNLFSNNTNRLLGLWNNQNTNSPEEIIIAKQYLIYLFYLNLINIYLILNKNDKNEFEKYINSIQNNLNTVIAYYIAFSSRIEETKKFLIPLSIIAILTNSFNQTASIQIPYGRQIHYGKFNIEISKIFEIISNDNNLNISISAHFKLLKELNIIYSFLDSFENIKIDKQYKTKILETILEENLYNDEILIDFSILLTTNIREKYRQIIDEKTNENSLWYKEYIIENLTNSNKILEKESLNFISYLKNWIEDEELKENIKNFLIENIDQIFNNDNLYNLLETFLTLNEKLNINYAKKSFGELLIDKFLTLSKHNDKLSKIFKYLENIFKNKDIEKYFLPNLIDKMSIKNLNDYQIDLLINNNILGFMEKEEIEKIFRRTIDEYENKNVYLFFKNILLKNKNKIDNDMKNEINEKLKEVQKNTKIDDIKNIINDILNDINETKS